MPPFLINASTDEHGDKKYLGTRNLIAEEDEIQPNGRSFKKAIYDDYSWLTYNEMHDYVKRISSGLKALGVEMKQNVIIFAETKAEWMLSAQACFMRNFPGKVTCSYTMMKILLKKLRFDKYGYIYLVVLIFFSFDTSFRVRFFIHSSSYHS